MKKSHLLWVLTILFSFYRSEGSAQHDFREGFIINLLQDTVRGLVDYRSNSQNYKSCRFKVGKDVIEYSPLELEGFGYDQDKVFTSSVIKGAFVEILVDGESSLYKSQDDYLLQLNDGKSYQFPKEISRENTGNTVNNRWIGIFKLLLQDCPDNLMDKKGKLRLNEQVITELTIQYNECQGADFTVYKARKPWTQLEWGVALGARSSVYTFTPMLLNKADYPYLENPFNSVDPSVGIVLAVTSPRLSEKFAFQPEVHFSKSYYTSELRVSGLEVEDFYQTAIELQTLSIPLSVRYSLPERKLSAFVQFGAYLEYHLDAKSSIVQERSDDNGVFSTKKLSFPIRKNQVGVIGGLGLVKPLNNYSCNLVLRYAQVTNTNQVTGIFHDSRQLSLVLILLRR